MNALYYEHFQLNAYKKLSNLIRLQHDIIKKVEIALTVVLRDTYMYNDYTSSLINYQSIVIPYRLIMVKSDRTNNK